MPVTGCWCWLCCYGVLWVYYIISSLACASVDSFGPKWRKHPNKNEINALWEVRYHLIFINQAHYIYGLLSSFPIMVDHISTNHSFSSSFFPLLWFALFLINLSVNLHLRNEEEEETKTKRNWKKEQSKCVTPNLVVQIIFAYQKQIAIKHKIFSVYMARNLFN